LYLCPPYLLAEKGLLGFGNHYLLMQTIKSITVVKSEFQNRSSDYELVKVNVGPFFSSATLCMIFRSYPHNRQNLVL
jgi:hypothetical protein